jgi:peptidoglycan glycosyltransferase
MNRQIRQLAVGLMVCYVALFSTLNYWSISRGDDLNARFDNTRQILREFNDPRGPIVTADGEVVARSVATPPGSKFEQQRVYPEGELFAHVTGYYTFGFGSTQVERQYDGVLTGNTEEQQLRALGNVLGGEDDDSGTVELTLDADLQRVARDALGQREGSIVVLEPSTGAVKAMWSYPSYDPNLIADPDFDTASDVLTFYDAQAGNPLLANAYQERYMPGSTFKVVTTGIALETGVVTTDRVFETEREFVPPQTTDPIQNYGGSSCGGSFPEVFARSCNTPFARLALEVGPERMVEGIARWGIGEPIPIDLPRPAASTFGDTSDLANNLPLLAIRGFGQNDDQMVPMHMAMVAATVANGGKMMEPYVVARTIDHEGRVLDETEPSVWKTPISEQNALILNSLMQGVATRGTASCCIGLANGISVAAKTGTAQLNATGEPERSHAWIVAFAPAENPQYAIAVMLKGTTAEISAGTGGRLAGPIAKTVLDAAFAGDA